MSGGKDTIFDILIDHGIDIRGRIIYLKGSIDDEAYDKFVKRIKYLDKTAGDIEVVLNSEGGCVTSGLAIHDAIKACDNPVTIKVYGAALSIASVILQAGDKRVMSKYSRIMIHRGESEIVGDFNNVKRQMKEQEDLDKILCKVYFEKITEENPDFKMSQLEKLMDFDTYFSADKALEFGLIDEVEGE